jgi:mRNA interferase RelE/StbE
MFSYYFHPKAVKELNRLPLKTQKIVVSKIRLITNLEYPLLSKQVIKLEGYSNPTYRLRIGDYRIIFQLRENSLYVISIHHRQKGY